MKAASALHSITRSARAKRSSGTLMPSADALFRLMTSSSRAGYYTGRSGGKHSVLDKCSTGHRVRTEDRKSDKALLADRRKLDNFARIRLVEPLRSRRRLENTRTPSRNRSRFAPPQFYETNVVSMVCSFSFAAFESGTRRCGLSRILNILINLALFKLWG
jgi:hypothetical protein